MTDQPDTSSFPYGKTPKSAYYTFLLTGVLFSVLWFSLAAAIFMFGVVHIGYLALVVVLIVLAAIFGAKARKVSCQSCGAKVGEDTKEIVGADYPYGRLPERLGCRKCDTAWQAQNYK